MYEVYIYYVYDIIYIYTYHDSTWKHLRQPCANLAPSLCFAGFPCVTPHNENVKSYKSVGCVPPRLKCLFRTFERLSYIYIHIIVVHTENSCLVFLQVSLLGIQPLLVLGNYKVHQWSGSPKGSFIGWWLLEIEERRKERHQLISFKYVASP